MDFRAMLKRRKYQKWAKEETQEKVDLKEVEKPMPALKKVEKVEEIALSVSLVLFIDISFFFLLQKQDSFLKPLVDQYAKEGKDKKVTFEANFSKPNCKPKWFFRKDVSVRFS